MLTLRGLTGSHVFGAPRRSGIRPRIGRVVHVLFHPTEPRVVGMLVERPDIAMVIRRRDRILALDRAAFDGGAVNVNGSSAWDSAAGSRLGIDWDRSVIWSGMPVRTESGRMLGSVRDAVFDPATGELNALGLSGGVTADVAVGVRDLPARLVMGFDGEAVVVADEAAQAKVDGGASAVAGRKAAVAKAEATKAVEAAAKTAAKAAVYGKAAAKAASQSKTGKKALGWLKSMKDEVVDAMGPPDDE